MKHLSLASLLLDENTVLNYFLYLIILVVVMPVALIALIYSISRRPKK
jgi:uncharacterized membrane protein